MSSSSILLSSYVTLMVLLTESEGVRRDRVVNSSFFGILKIRVLHIITSVPEPVTYIIRSPHTSVRGPWQLRTI
jgi:hypothetical protein